MQNEAIHLSPIKQSDLFDAIREIVKGELKVDRDLAEKKKLLSVREVTELFSVTKMTVFNWVKRELIAPVKIGKRTYFRKEDIDKHIIQLGKYKRQ